MATVNLNDLSITSFETVMGCNINGGAFRFMLDEMQNLTISNTQENTNLTGRGGRTIGMLKRNKAVNITGTNGMVSIGLVEVETGSKAETNVVTTVKVPDYIQVDSEGKLATTFVATGTAGNEIGELYVKDGAGVVVKTLTQAATAAEGKFAYDPTTKAITFASGELKKGDNVTVYYKRKINADVVVKNISENYAEKLELYIDAIAEDKCKNQYRVQFFVPYADFTGNFDFAMGDSQTVQNFEATSLASACSIDGSSLFWTLTVFGADAKDVTD